MPISKAKAHLKYSTHGDKKSSIYWLSSTN